MSARLIQEAAMITDKQKQRDYEYDGDYQSKSRYTAEQWGNILTSGQIEKEDLSLLSQIYSSYNHAATLLQLSFHNKATEEELLSRLDAIGSKLGEANGLNPEVNYEGQEYWWYLCFWGKNTPERTLELKLHPELTEAIGALRPELEQAYYAFMNDVDRSLQSRPSQEDAVWIAAAVLLYEKYYRNPGISADDILLMQYEVQTRAQKVYGQDVNVNTITQICNADERGHRFNYLRDIYKYYRISYPGEFEGDRERPDPETLNYSSYIYSLFGYMTLNDLLDFIEHEYAHLVDESYVELNNSNGFVRLADFLTRQGGSLYQADDSSEGMLALRADGEDCITTFHMLSEALLKEYPNFTYAKKADWLLPEENRTAYIFCDLLYMEDYAYTGASISFITVPEGDAVHIEIALNLPLTASEEAMLDIQDKCNMLTLMTAAPFKVETVDTSGFDLSEAGQKIKAFVFYDYKEFMTMKEEDIIGMMSTSMEIFASYYTDICQNYYPSKEDMDNGADPLAAALGSKLVYRQAAEVPGPQVIYKEAASSPSTDFITRAIQGYGQPQPAAAEESPDYSAETSYISGNISSEDPQGNTSPIPEPSSGMSGPALSAQSQKPSGKNTDTDIGLQTTGSLPSMSSTGAAPASGAPLPGFAPYAMGTSAYPAEEKVPVSTHPDRKEQGFRLYPKNTLIKGPVKTGKYHEAIMTAVGIIEGKDSNMIGIEPVPEVLEHYKNYIEEERILQISYPDIRGDGYDGFMESVTGSYVRDGIFKEFANRCEDGRYVLMLEEADLNWTHLLGEASVLLRENRREGASSETTITLPGSKEKFRLPNNLYIVATCDSVVCEDTILGAIAQDFFIRHIAPDASVLHGIRIEGILLERLMVTINLRLSYFLGADFQLGEGFFLASPDKDPFISLCRVFREQIIPLFEKWFDGDIEKVRYVLGDNGKKRADTIFYQEMPYRDGLFKGTIPDSFDTERCIYQINEDAFYNPKSYIDIYES